MDAEGHVTMTFWDSLDDYEAWRDGSGYERAHTDRSSEATFEAPNEVEIHELIVER